MKNYGLRAVAGLALLLAATSCTQDESEGRSGNHTPEELVEVGFSIKINSLKAGDDATYSLSETEYESTRTIPGDIKDGSDAVIKNLWVIQFEEGIGDAGSKKMVGVPRFISSDDLSADEQKGTVQLISTEEPCYIIWVANHPLGEAYRWNLPLNATMKDVAAKIMQIESEADTYPKIDGTHTIMMNAITDTKIESGEELNPVFNRNYARVTLKLRLDAETDEDNPDEDYKILSVRLRNVPVNVTLSELALGPIYTNIIPNDETIYPYGSPMIDFPAVDATHLINKENNADTFTWYVPRNQQGITDSDSYKSKNYYAPANATYFEVIAQHKIDAATYETAVFRVYPGANQENNHILLPNHAYTSNLVVRGIGDSASPDSRVENFDDVVYSEQEAANCYILNPAPAGGRTRKYTIPITHAIKYWSGTMDGYGNTPDNVIKNNDQWVVSFLWSDLEKVYEVVKFDHEGEGTGPDDKFSINIPAGVPAFNFTVKLTRKDSNIILWSWHFWVTDYNPDAFNHAYLDRDRLNPGGIPNGTFTYPVPNGQVERYAYGGANNNMWETVYADKVMMDRPLGAVENYFTEIPVFTTSYTTTTRGHIYYQFGRKDPFPAVTTNTGGYADIQFGSFMTRISTSPNVGAGVNMSEAVLNPTQFYNRSSGGSWCENANGYSTKDGYVWHDPNAPILGAAVGTDYSGKSIYDPCPPGWKVPSRGIWLDFSLNGTVQNVVRDLGWTDGRGVSNVKGLRYWPGIVDSPVGGTIFYAASGKRTGNSSNASTIGGTGTAGYTWSAVASTANGGTSLLFQEGSLTLGNSAQRSDGMPVRCVSE